MSEYESNPKVFRTNRQNLTRMIQSSKSNEDDSMKYYTTNDQKSQDKTTHTANSQPVSRDVADNNSTAKTRINVYQGNLTITKRITNLDAAYRAILHPSDDLVSLTQRCRELSSKVPQEPSDKKSQAYKAYQVAKRPYSKFKLKLPAVTFNAKFKKNKRGIDTLLSATGRVVIDYDGFESVEQMHEVAERLRAIPFLEFMFISPSGLGLKLVVRINRIVADDAEYKKVFTAVTDVVDKIAGVAHDGKCKDSCRLTFIVADKNAYWNRDAVQFVITDEMIADAVTTETKQQPANKKHSNNTSHIEYTGDRLPDEVIADALSYVSPDVDYGAWIAMGAGLYHSGYPFYLWDNWSRGGAKYNEGECASKWDGFGTYSGTTRTVGSIIYEAEQHGWTLPKRTRINRTTRIKKPTNEPDVVAYKSLEVQRNLIHDICHEIVNTTSDLERPRVDIIDAAVGTGKSFAMGNAVKEKGNSDVKHLFVSHNNDAADQSYADLVNKIGEKFTSRWEGRETGWVKLKDKTYAERNNANFFALARCPMFREWELARDKGIDFCQHCTLKSSCLSLEGGYLKQYSRLKRVTSIALGEPLSWGLSDFYKELRTRADKQHIALIIDDYTLSDLVIDFNLTTKLWQGAIDDYLRYKDEGYEPYDEETQQHHDDYTAFYEFAITMNRAISEASDGVDFYNKIAHYLEDDAIMRGCMLIYNEDSKEIQFAGDAHENGLMLELMRDSTEQAFMQLKHWCKENAGKDVIAYRKNADGTRTLKHKAIFTGIKHTILMSGTTPADIADAAIPEDVDVIKHSIAPPPLADDVQIYQRQSGKYTAQSVFEYTGDNASLREPARETLETICNLATEERRVRGGASLFTSWKELNPEVEDGALRDDPILKKINNAFDYTTHYGASEALNFDDLKTIVAFGFPRVKHEVVWDMTAELYGVDIGSYEDATEKGVDTISEGGHKVEQSVLKYKHPHADAICQALGKANLQQAIGRIRPHTWEGTAVFIYTASLMQISAHAELFVNSDLENATSISDLGRVIKSREQSYDKAVSMAREGHGRPAIMKATGISERLARSICRQYKRDAQESTGHVESQDTNTAGHSQRGVPFEHVQLNADSRVSLPETSDNGTGHVESQDTKPYHKDVAGMLTNLMSDGIERRTGEIVAMIDASAAEVKRVLSEKFKTGEIIKVRYGVYLMPSPEAESQNEDTTMEFQTDIPKAEWDADPVAEADARIEPEHAETNKVDLDDETDIVYIADIGDGRARVSQHKKDTHRRFVIVDLEAQLPSADPTEEDGYYVVDAWELIKAGFFRMLIETENRFGKDKPLILHGCSQIKGCLVWTMRLILRNCYR